MHGVDETGKPMLVRTDVPRAKLLELIANLFYCSGPVMYEQSRPRLLGAMLKNS